jgi:hypothetical protein
MVMVLRVMHSVLPPEFTKTVCNNPPLERPFNCSMVELLTLHADLPFAKMVGSYATLLIQKVIY